MIYNIKAAVLVNDKFEEIFFSMPCEHEPTIRQVIKHLNLPNPGHVKKWKIAKDEPIKDEHAEDCGIEVTLKVKVVVPNMRCAGGLDYFFKKYGHRVLEAAYEEKCYIKEVSIQSIEDERNI